MSNEVELRDLCSSEEWQQVLQGLQIINDLTTDVDSFQRRVPEAFGVTTVSEVIDLLKEMTHGREPAILLILQSHKLGIPLCELHSNYILMNPRTKSYTQTCEPISAQCADFWQQGGERNSETDTTYIAAVDDIAGLLNVGGKVEEWEDENKINEGLLFYDSFPKSAHLITREEFEYVLRNDIPATEVYFKSLQTHYALFSGSFILQERIGEWTFSITTTLEHLQSKYGIQVEDTTSIGSTNLDVYFHPNFQHDEIDSHESKVQNYLLFRSRWTSDIFATLKTTLTSPIDFSQATIHIYNSHGLTIPYISFDDAISFHPSQWDIDDDNSHDDLSFYIIKSDFTN